MNLSQALQQALQSHQQGRLDHAAQRYLAILDARPDHFDARHLLGILRSQQGRDAEALDHIGAALKLRPESAAAWSNLALVQGKLGKASEALSSLEKALAVNPNAPEVLNNRGSMLRNLQRHAEALASYDRALAVKPDYVEALYNRGTVLLDLQRHTDAMASFDKALAIYPANADALNNRGNVLRELKRSKDALASYDKALALNPDHAEFLYNRGAALLDLGRLEDALASFQRALALKPDHAAALHNCGSALLELKRPAEALASFDRALAIDPGSAQAHNDRGSALFALKQPEAALTSYDSALAIKPDHAEALNNRGNALLALKRSEEALATYDRALAIRPDYAEPLNNRGNALLALKRPEEALASYDQALTIKPDYAEALNNCGNALRDLKRPEDALASYHKALSIVPDYVEALNNRGSALFDMKRLEDALASFEQALAIQPGFDEALCNRGAALFELKRYDEAAQAYAAVLRSEPRHPEALAMLAQATSLCCNWEGADVLQEKLRASIQQGAFNGSCFGILSTFDDVLLQRGAAEGLCANRTGAPMARPALAVDAGKRRLRVGYLSADFRTHAVAFLLSGLIEAHDRSFCETYGLFASPDDDSPERKRLAAGFDRCIDVAGLSDTELCHQVRAAGIDILVDLGGHTKDSRLLDLARRPALIQISYLGYPGSTGAPFIDYIFADEFVIPKETGQHYAEKVVYLPDCFQANDDKRMVAPVVPTRAQCGLPEQGFVFCAFHNSYKINPATFDIWMRLLGSVPCSVIWLASEAAAHNNLRREAHARGVDPSRIVFAGHETYARHLARQKLADLFLDAWPYNGGTTVSDALWVGLPVVTWAGQSYAARMAGSLLQAVGLPELISYSPEAYEALALRLATNPALLNDVRRRLAANIGTAPLFNTARFARHIEAAYAQMWETHQRGESPEGFSVQPLQTA
jgi:protein O-GlcNAc transferase